MAAYALLSYFSVPVNELSTPEQVVELRRILEAGENGPVLIYGIDRDQPAAAWALVRVASGVPLELALEEGRTAGLHARLPAVRKRLGFGPGTIR